MCDSKYVHILYLVTFNFPKGNYSYFVVVLHNFRLLTKSNRWWQALKCCMFLFYKRELEFFGFAAKG